MKRPLIWVVLLHCMIDEFAMIDETKQKEWLCWSSVWLMQLEVLASMRSESGGIALRPAAFPSFEEW